MPDHADNLAPRLVAAFKAHPAAERGSERSVRKIPANELFVDNRHRRRVRAILGVEEPAGEQRNSKRLMIAFAYPESERERPLGGVLRFGFTFDPIAVFRRPTQREPSGHSGNLHTRQLLEAPLRFVEENDGLRWIGVFHIGQPEAEGKNISRFKSGIDLHQVPEALDKKTGA